MSILLPNATTLGDIVNEALKLSGRLGLGQTALAEDATLGWSYLQMMLQQWDQQRIKVYRTQDYSIVSTGAVSYTVGPSGDIDTGASSVRPPRVVSAFVRLITATNEPDWPVEILNAREDYNQIRLKSLTSVSSFLWYDPAWPLGVAYPWPVLTASEYELHLSLLTQLPYVFATQATVFSIPYVYYWAMITNLAMRLRGRYGIGTYPGDVVPSQAISSINALKETNNTIPRLQMPQELTIGGSGYNIFSDRFGS